MLTREDIEDLMGFATGKVKWLIEYWHDHCMQQIRLNSANLQRIEERRQAHIEAMDKKKRERFRAWRERIEQERQDGEKNTIQPVVEGKDQSGKEDMHQQA